MNPVSATLNPAALSQVSGPTPQLGMFQDLLNFSVAQVDSQAELQVDVVPTVEAPVNVPAMPLVTAPVPDAQSEAGVTGLGQPVAIESSAEEAATAEADKAEIVSSAHTPAPVPPPVAPIRAQVSVPVQVPTPQPAPQPRKQVANIETAKPVSDARSKWISIATAAPSMRTDAMPQTSEPVLTPTMDVIGNREGSFDSRFGIAAASQSVADSNVPASYPVADTKQLVMTQDGEWIGALARDIVSNAARDNQLVFTLMPENLGQLDIALTTDNGQVDIRLETSTNAAAQIIAADQARLIEDLRNAGLKLGQFDMSNRQNGNGQPQPQKPDGQRTETSSTSTQPQASSKAYGRFA